MSKTKSRLLRASSIVFATVLALLVYGCGGSSSNNNLRTIYGAYTQIGNSQVRAYVTRQGNVPIAVGVEFSPSIVNGLPTNIPFGQDKEYPLQIPPDVNAVTPIQGISIDYTPGHPPTGNGDVPHFHPTFFLVSSQTRQTILPGAAGANVPIPITMVPSSHIAIGSLLPAVAVVPTEGIGYFDPNLASYNGPFTTTTYQYDFWNGVMDAIQLGVANSFIAQQPPPSQSDFLALPQQYGQPGYFPTHYTFTFNSTRGVYTMALDQFVLRDTNIINTPGLPDLANAAGQTTTYGQTQQVAGGLARTYVTLDSNSVPVTVGIEFSPGVLTNLPLLPEDRAQDYPLPVPAELAKTKYFVEASLIWSPGHPPPSSVQVSLFQANFWLISRTTRIGIFPPTLSIANNPPPGSPIVPAGVVPAGALIPFEGEPYFDPTNPQWTGAQGTFSTTRYNYDFWQGAMDGLEVSAAAAFLGTKQEASGALAQPQTYPQGGPGYFPSTYDIKYDSNLNVYTYSIGGFASH